MKIQEAIIKKNSMKSKLKNVVESFEFIWDKNKPDILEKDLKDVTSKSFGILSQYTQLQSQIALKNSQVKIEFNGKTMTLIELIFHMQMLNQKVVILKSIKAKIHNLNESLYYDSKSDETDVSVFYEKRKIISNIDEQIESIREELRKAQTVLEKTNWTEDI